VGRATERVCYSTLAKSGHRAPHGGDVASKARSESAKEESLTAKRTTISVSRPSLVLSVVVAGDALLLRSFSRPTWAEQQTQPATSCQARAQDRQWASLKLQVAGLNRACAV
jgi:hypothetical protein